MFRKAEMTHSGDIYHAYRPIWIISEVFGLYIFIDDFKSKYINLHMSLLIGLQLFFVFCCYYDWSITSFQSKPETALDFGRNIVLIVCVGVIHLNMYCTRKEMKFIVQSFFHLKKEILQMRTVNKKLSTLYLNFSVFILALIYANYPLISGNLTAYQNYDKQLIYMILSPCFVIVFLSLLQYEVFVEYVNWLFISMSMKSTSPYTCESCAKSCFILYRICKVINKVYAVPVLMGYIFIFYLMVNGISIFVGNLQDLTHGGNIQETFMNLMPRTLLRLTFFFQICSLNSRCTKLRSQAKKINKKLFSLMMDNYNGQEMLNNPILNLHFSIKRKILFSVNGTLELNYLLTLIMINGIATYSIVLLQFFNYSC